MPFISGPRNKKERLHERLYFCTTNKTVSPQENGRAHKNVSNKVTAYQNEPHTATSLENEIVLEKLIHC